MRNFRLKFGRDIVDPYVREAVIERKEVFSDIFSSELVEDFEGKEGKKIKRWVTYCNNVPEFLQRVAKLRKKKIEDLTFNAISSTN